MGSCIQCGDYVCRHHSDFRGGLRLCDRHLAEYDAEDQARENERRAREHRERVAAGEAASASAGELIESFLAAAKAARRPRRRPFPFQPDLPLGGSFGLGWLIGEGKEGFDVRCWWWLRKDGLVVKTRRHALYVEPKEQVGPISAGHYDLSRGSKGLHPSNAYKPEILTPDQLPGSSARPHSQGWLQMLDPRWEQAPVALVVERWLRLAARDGGLSWPEEHVTA